MQRCLSGDPDVAHANHIESTQPAADRQAGRPAAQPRGEWRRAANRTVALGPSDECAVIGKFQGDTATFRQSLAERAGEFTKYGDMAQAAGGTHHRFGAGDGFVVVDERESAEQFQQFLSSPGLQAFIGSTGAEPAPPEMTVCEAVASPDQY